MLRFLAQGKGLSTRILSFGASELSELSSALVAQNCSKSPLSAHRVAQSRSESLRARPEPLRAAQSVRSELFEEPLWVAQSRVAQSGRSGSPRARPELLCLKSRSESHGVCPEPLRVAPSCSKNRSGSSVSHALCISDAQFYFTWFPLLRACICTGSH